MAEKLGGGCGNWGHRRRGCRKKVYDDKGKSKGATVSSAGAEGPSVGAITDEDWRMGLKPYGWAFAVLAEFVACSAGTLDKGFSSSATLAQTSICACTTSQTTSHSNPLGYPHEHP